MGVCIMRLRARLVVDNIGDTDSTGVYTRGTETEGSDLPLPPNHRSRMMTPEAYRAAN